MQAGNRDSPETWGAVTYSGTTTVRPTHPDAPTPERRAGRAHLTYAPGLDGVRALAVTAVVVYHLGVKWLPGGFLGVDVFFTLSGYLITSILLTEFHSRGKLDIKNFYLRRARRLLPALFTMLALVTLVVSIFARGELNKLRGDDVAALTYCTNWTQIFWNRSYFAQLAQPSLLQHLWSLAVEEQFYLLWPLILVAALAARRRWAPAAVALGLTAVSAILMASLFHGGSDPSRVYYGTDTHISPMLIGAALAAIVVRQRRQREARRAALHIDAHRSASVLADLAALAGVAALAYACTGINYYTAGLYRGGYLIVGVAAAALVYAAGRPDTVTGRLLSRRPLVWIGQRSYAIYLWHWPILQLTRAHADVPFGGPVLVILQVGAILLASDLSYRYVEKPIRSRGVRAFFNDLAHPGRVGTAVVCAVTGVAAVLVTAPAPAPGIDVGPGKTPTVHIAAPASAHQHRKRVLAPQPPFPRPVRVSFFGDSQGMTLLINKPNGLRHDLITSDSTVEGCSVLLGTIHSRVGYTRDLSADCANWPQLWREHAAEHHPQIAAVEIGAWDVFDDTLNGKLMRFGSPAWDAYFSKQLAKGIRVLIHAGAQVALIGVPCYRPIAAGGLPALPERGQDWRTRHVTSLLRQAAKADPQRVFMVTPPKQFCHGPISTNVHYRWDGTHFYKPGAALMFKVITPQLLAIPQPPPRRTH